MSTELDVPWAIAGSYFEACNCEAVCPCRSVGGRPGGRSTEGICQFALSWRVAAGHFGATDLANLDVVMAGFYEDDVPGSPWQIVLYVDERSSAAQFDALSAIFLGRAGGTARNNFAAAIATVHAVRRATITLEHGPAKTIRVAGHVEVAANETVDVAEAVACGIPGLDHPGQEMRARVFRVDDVPLRWNIEGRCAFATDFDYRSR